MTSSREAGSVLSFSDLQTREDSQKGLSPFSEPIGAELVPVTTVSLACSEPYAIASNPHQAFLAPGCRFGPQHQLGQIHC